MVLSQNLQLQSIRETDVCTKQSYLSHMFIQKQAWQSNIAKYLENYNAPKALLPL